MADPSDEQLREAARARGFRLVKSRRRKPGGDFGRYGLADLDSGRECMGFGRDGLTATAEEVLSYLRGGEVASWKRSLIGVVEKEEAKEPKNDAKEEEEGPTSSARPERAEGDRRSSRGASAPRPDRHTAASPKRSSRAAKAARERSSTSLGTSEETGERPIGKPDPTIRDATRRDAAALAKLIGIPAATLSDRLTAAIRNDEAPLVAEQDGLVGAVAWTSVPTLQHGPQGRITLLHVTEPARRQGLGSRLLAEAEQRLRDAGVERLEIALDIDFDAPTGFLRHTGFARTTNGYAKGLE